MSAGKKIGIGVGVVVALVIGAMLILPWVINPNDYRDQIISQAEKALGGRQVEIGRIKLSLWTGLRLKVDQFRVGNREGFSEEPLLEVKQFEIKLSLLSLLSDTIRVKRIVLKQPRIFLERNEKGELSVADLLQPSAEARPEKPQAEAEAAPKKNFAVSSLRIEQGRLVFDDMKSPTGEYVSSQIDQLEVTVTDLSLDKPLKLLVSAAVQSDQPNLEIKGRFGPIGEDYQLSAAAADLQLTLLAFPLTFAQPYYTEYLPVEIASGRLETNLKLTGEVLGKLAAAGTLALREFAYIDKRHLAPPSPKFDVVIEEKAWFDRKQGAFALEPGSQATLGPLVLKVSGSGEDLSRSQKITLQGESEKVALAELIKLLPSLGKSFQESGYRLGGRGQTTFSLAGDKSARQVHLLLDLNDASVEMPDLLQKGVGEPLSLELAAQLTEKNYLIESLKLILGALQLSAQGKIGAGEELPAEISLESNPVPFASLQKNLAALKDLTPGGTVRLSATLIGPLAKTDQVELRLVGLQYQSDHSDALLTGSVKNLDAPRISFALSSQALNLDKLFPPSTETAAPAKAAAPAAGAAAPAEEESSLKKMVVDGSMTLKKVIYSGLLLSNVTMKLGLHKGVLESPGLSGGVAGGSFNLPFRVDLLAKEPAFTVKPSLNGVDINQVLSALTDLKDSIKGKVKGQVEVSGVGTEWEKMNKTLTGQGHLELQDGSVKGFDLFGGLMGEWAKSDAVRKYAASGMGKAESAALSETKFTELSSDLKIRDGQVRVPNAVMAVAQGKVEAEGKFGFDYKTDFQGKVMVTEEETKKITKNAGIGPEFQALLLEDGKLVLPFVLKGTYPDLKVLFDGGEYGKIVQNNLKKAAGKAVKEGAKKLLEGKDLKNMKFDDFFKP